MGTGHPATLEVVCRQLRGAGFRKIRLLTPHSTQSTGLLDAATVHPTAMLDEVLSRYHPADAVVVAPDLGATDRVREAVRERFIVVQGLKHRDPATGQLSAFSVREPNLVKDKLALIIDDCCDGGGTFTGLSVKLHEAGARAVDLAVTHGIFSKGVPLPGIRLVYSTDSYQSTGSVLEGGAEMVFPVHMKDMR